MDNHGLGKTSPPQMYTMELTEPQVLDVLASVQTSAQMVNDLETKARLTALLDNIAAQTGATQEGAANDA